MMPPIAIAEIKDLVLNRLDSVPLASQLYLALRQQILAGRLSPAARLPSTRVLAAQLGIGRNTVIQALEQLQTEGYIELKPGAGSFISEQIPDHWRPGSDLPGLNLESSRFTSVHGQNQGFCVGVPDLKAFPHKIWNRLAQQQSFSGVQNLMGFGDPEGYWPLREAVADYVRTSRAVRCRPEQILITSGAQQGLELACRVLLQKGDVGAIEEPGYRGMRRALQVSANTMLAVPVDGSGIEVGALVCAKPVPKLVYVTPANQYPMGVVLSLERKSTLLEWAANNQSWVIEDDYDSEYHYHHRPLASLQGIDVHQRVVYVGSFSKVLFPALRLGYLILPETLMKDFVAAKQQSAGDAALHSQAVTAAFIKEGHFNRHLRRMRLNYAQKLQHLLDCCIALKPWCKVHSSGAGLHIVLEFTVAIDEDAVAKQLLELGVYCSVFKQYFFTPGKRQGLVLGFANSSVTEITDKVKLILAVLSSN